MADRPDELSISLPPMADRPDELRLPPLG